MEKLLLVLHPLAHFHTMTFAQTGLSSNLLHNLEKVKITNPTPIQEQTIPLILAGSNVVGVAHTGTGKTYAFALPLIDRLIKEGGIALILAPTRELAQQLDRNIRKINKGIPKMNPSVLVNGEPIEHQAKSLKTGPRIVIATPGRLNDHLDSKSFALNDVRIVVLDEADRLLDSGFGPQIERILDRSPKERQTLLFSATRSDRVAKLVARFAPDATYIKIEDELHDMSLVQQQVCLIGSTRRVALLTKLIHETHGKVLVFAANKRSAQTLYRAMADAKFSVAGLHGDRTAAGREEAIDGFFKNRYRVLVTTDLGSRGIDVPAISLVINYDVPADYETYVHRIGRTGRAGVKGRAITFAPPEQRKRMKLIEEGLLTTLDILPK